MPLSTEESPITNNAGTRDEDLGDGRDGASVGEFDCGLYMRSGKSSLMIS